MLKYYPSFDGKDKAQYLEYKYRLGDRKPTAAQNSTVVAMWERVNEKLFSILFVTTERSANHVVKKRMGKTRGDGVGNGQAPEEKYNNHTKEAWRSYHETLHSTIMKLGNDPEDFL